MLGERDTDAQTYNRKHLTTTIKPNSTLPQTQNQRSVKKSVKENSMLEKISLAERERVGKQGECSYDYECPSKWQGWCYQLDQCRYKRVMAKDGTMHWEGWESQGAETK